MLSMEERIGFLIKCLFLEAITLSEVNGWATRVIASEANYPLELLELMEYKGTKAGIYKLFRKMPYIKLSKEEEKAIVGIAYKRKLATKYSQYSQNVGEKALAAESHIKELFEQEFVDSVYPPQTG